MSKSKILIFAKYYLPGYKAGGPIRSISNIVEALSDKFEFYIVTKDRDSFDKDSYLDISVDVWNTVGKANVYYTSANIGYKKINFLLNERKYDALYLNSFLSYNFSVLPLLINKKLPKKKRLGVLLAPRGEFSEGALQLGATKKRLFIKLMAASTLYNKVIWQASSEYEKQDILRAMNVNHENIMIAPNIPTIQNQYSDQSIFNNILKIIFVSRISPKKNLDYALRVLGKCKVPIEFNIYGLISDTGYWVECEELIKSMPKNIAVVYHGSIANDQVSTVLRKSDLFFLPTKGENYGHAIVESFMAGTPVLISDQTPWRNLRNKGVGWDIPLDKEAVYVDSIDNYYYDIQNDLKLDTNLIQDWFLNEIDYKETINKNEGMFFLVCK